MFQKGDLVVYQNMGVCLVKDVTEQDFGGAAGKKPYYLLEPTGARGTIYIPVDTDVFIRPVISAAEAERLIDQIPSIRAEAFHSAALQELTQHYSAAFVSHDCEDLIQLVMSIYAKKRVREQQNQKFGTVDEGFMKRAEELLYGEFAVALGIPREDVPGYIAKRVKAAEKKKPADA